MSKNEPVSKNQQQILVKMNAIVNRCGGDQNIVRHLDQLPRTIKNLIYSSEELMLRFKLIELIPDRLDPFAERE